MKIKISQKECIIIIQEYLINNSKPSEIILVGKKLVPFLAKLSMPADLVYRFTDYKDLSVLANDIFKAIKIKFQNNQIGSAKVIFTKFESIGNQFVDQIVLIPKIVHDVDELERQDDMLLEPSKEDVSEYIINELVRTNIHFAMAESIASEYLSRMLAMKKATDAAQDIIEILQTYYNKTRQAQITKEITEIVAGMQNSIENSVDLQSFDTNNILYNIKLFFIK